MIQQNDFCELNDCTNKYGILKQLYMKQNDLTLTIYCAIQWFIQENINDHLNLICTDWIEEDITISKIVNKIKINQNEGIHLFNFIF
jgi:hypothetical protein